MPTVYTIGYATKTIDCFLAQLDHYQIDTIADIRSVPYSKVFFDYHKEALQNTLKQHALKYVYLGEELGPRSKDDSHYDQRGQVQFDRLMKSSLFIQGIERLHIGAERGYRIALMCAEKDAITCHRSLLVGYYLARLATPEQTNAWVIKHITHEGQVETQNELEQRMRHLNGADADLFMSDSELNTQNYTIQLKKTSYTRT